MADENRLKDIRRPERAYLLSFFLAPVFAAVLILTATLWAAESSYDVVMKSDRNEQILEDFRTAADAADVTILMFGNSRLRHAADFGYDPARLITLPDARSAAILQFSENAAYFLSYRALEDMAREIQPDMVVMMGVLLSNRRYPYGRLKKYGQMVYNMFAWQMEPPVTGTANRATRQDLMSTCFKDYSLREVNSRIVATAHRDAHSLDMAVNGDNLRAVREFVRDMRAGGTAVVILRLPPNMGVLDDFNIPRHVLDFYGLGRMPTESELLPAQYDDVVWLEYEPPGGRADYCDFVHLNAKGRAHANDWLLAQFSALIPAR